MKKHIRKHYIVKIEQYQNIEEKTKKYSVNTQKPQLKKINFYDDASKVLQLYH